GAQVDGHGRGVGAVVDRVGAGPAVHGAGHARAVGEGEVVGGAAAGQVLDVDEPGDRAGDVAGVGARDVPGVGLVRPDERVAAGAAVEGARQGPAGGDRDRVVAAAGEDVDRLADGQ